MPRENTKQVLEKLLTNLYSEQAKEKTTYGGSYLIAQDGQYLGKITDNIYDNDSLLNQYGPYGSQYSTTSIFNKYSQYGSPYGSYSINNPYTSTPPKLYINNVFKGYVTVNRYLSGSIPTATFLYMLKNSMPSLMTGVINVSITEARRQQQESYIEAQNGVFIGSLNPNELDNDSIFNKFSEFGSQFSPTSIFNTFSEYGNAFSQLSAYNEFANMPPKIYLNGRFIGLLTKNTRFTNRIDPDDILSWAKRNVQYRVK